MAAGPTTKTPTAQCIGYKGEQAKVFTAMKKKYGAWWVRASNGEAYATFGPNPYSTGPFANVTEPMVTAFREGKLY